MSVEQFVAELGDHCEHCGQEMNEGQPLFMDVSKRVRSYFCAEAHCKSGVKPEHSPAYRFMNAVLAK